MDTTIVGLAGAFLLVALGVFSYQRRAKACPRHNRWVGYVATVVAILCVLASLALLATAWSTSATPKSPSASLEIEA